MRRAAVWMLLLTGAMTLVSCSAETIKTEPEGSVSTELRTDSPTETPPAETAPTETEGPAKTGTEAEEDDSAVFFGKRMKAKIAAVNERTLSDPGSMLYDVLSGESFTVLRVLELIQAYSVPKNGYYGKVPVNDDVRTAILDNRELKSLTDRLSGESAASPVIHPRYGILVTNASVRSFPTSVRFTASGQAEDFDLFQESALPFASGVLLLHDSADGTYSFCVGEYYSGWIRREDIAETDEETFRAYLTPDAFAVSLGTDEGVLWNRLGLLIPIESETETALTLRIPSRDDAGRLEVSSFDVSNDSKKYHVGFLKFTPEAVREIALGLLGTPYGWGDEHGYYDCSGFTGALYRVFGYFLPRNSSAMAAFGGTKIDLKHSSVQEKLEALRKHPGAVVSWPGHAMLFSGVLTAGCEELFEIIQEGTGWCDSNGVWTETNRVTVSDLTTMIRTNGRSFLESVETLIAID